MMFLLVSEKNYSYTEFSLEFINHILLSLRKCIKKLQNFGQSCGSSYCQQVHFFPARSLILVNCGDYIGQVIRFESSRRSQFIVIKYLDTTCFKKYLDTVSNSFVSIFFLLFFIYFLFCSLFRIHCSVFLDTCVCQLRFLLLCDLLSKH